MYERFLQLLDETGLTAYRVAKETGIATSTFSDWKTGRSTPKQDKLIIVADYFNVSLDWLVGASDTKQVYTPKDEDKKPKLRSMHRLAEFDDWTEEEDAEMINYMNYLRSKRKGK